jgi:hypothetical protein
LEHLGKLGKTAIQIAGETIGAKKHLADLAR